MKGSAINAVVCFYLLIFAIIVVNQNPLFAQANISGKITDPEETELPSALIVVKDFHTGKTVSYTVSQENGEYSIDIERFGKFVLVVTNIGYYKKVHEFDIVSNVDKLILNVVLHFNPTVLDEVIIVAENPISIKKDTVNFKTKYFVNGTEQTVEELLKKIPGIQIDSEGTIKVGNQEIEKLLVEGDDLFERGYKILSKNMPAYPIVEVEVIKNYSNNRLLKEVEESNKVVLNLKLDEESKRIWFGNIETSFGNDSFYELRGNLMNFGKKNKYYFLTNLNTIGYDATGDIEHLIQPFRINEPASIGDNQQVDNLISLSETNLNFKRSRTNFNNAELVSLNAIFNPSKKLKIKTLGFFNSDETGFFSNRIDIVNVKDAHFINTEDYQLHNKLRMAFGKLDIGYNISATKMLEATTKFRYGDFDDSANLIFNDTSTIEKLKYASTLIDQKISYTNKFKSRKVFLLTGRFIDEKVPQDYNINQFFYEEFFSGFDNANNVEQSNTNQMLYAGINAHLLDRLQNEDLLELQVGNEYRKDKLSTTFSLFEDEQRLGSPNGYQNRTTYEVNDLFLRSKYRYKINDFVLVGKMAIHQLFSRLKNNGVTDSQVPFFVNPSLGFDWELNSKNRIAYSYSFSTTNANVLDVFSDFSQTGFRSFSKGTDGFNQLDASNIILNYQLGNWSDRFFLNSFFLYGKNHDFFSTNTLIEQNFIQSEKILIKDREFIGLNSNLDYYFKFLSSNLKLDVGYSKSEFMNIVNNSNLRRVISSTYNSALELRTAFNIFFNFHIGTKWTTAEVETTLTNSFTNNVSFLDLSFVFSDKFDVQLQSERYYFGYLQTNNTYYFLDFRARYNLIKDKLILGLTGNNLFNTKKFRDFSVSDIGTSTTEYRLLPRFLLLKIEYRF